MKLLFITHKVHELDDDLAFATLWAQEFNRQGFEVTIVCYEKGVYNGTLPLYSMGKEDGVGYFGSLLRLWKIILTVPHDRVFVHMNPKWLAAGSWLWLLKGTPMYLWYTHYTMNVGLWISGVVAKRMFCATVDSLPQYTGNPKKVVTGHGIDMRFWDMPLLSRDERKPRTELLMVHRLSRSKRIHLVLQALALLPEYRVTIIGRAIEKDYFAELQQLVVDLKLEDRVVFQGPLPMPELRAVYPHYQIFVNMASDTIDKTMVESLCAGLQVVTSKNNADAIGLLSAPADDSPEAIAAYIRDLVLQTPESLKEIAVSKHSLSALMQRMGAYISKGA